MAYYDVCVAGAGASGLATAVSLALDLRKNQGDIGYRVVVIEKKKKPGRKVAASGNGRCNMSNFAIPGWKETEVFFREIGIVTRTDSQGRIYPYSESSADVVGALVGAAKKLGVEFFMGSEIEDIDFPSEESLAMDENKNRQFTIKARKDGELVEITTSNLVVAMGGKSAPETGSTGDGYGFAKKAGHKVTRLIPVLTSVETLEKPREAGYSGVRAKAEVSLVFRNKEVFREAGEVQFTDYGISGICIFNLSRYMMIPEGRTLKNGFDEYRIEIDLVPDISREDLTKEISLRLENGLLNSDLRNLLRSFVKRELADELALRIGADRLGQAAAISERLKNFTMHPKGTKGWKFAQVTRGGVGLSEVDPSTQESKIIDNLYFTGEVLDFDGPCGGFNLQNAWSTGIKCGRAISERLRR